MTGGVWYSVYRHSALCMGYGEKMQSPWKNLDHIGVVQSYLPSFGQQFQVSFKAFSGFALHNRQFFLGLIDLISQCRHQMLNSVLITMACEAALHCWYRNGQMQTLKPTFPDAISWNLAKRKQLVLSLDFGHSILSTHYFCWEKLCFVQIW